MIITIFFSWQSDTKFNQKSIRDAIRQAAIEIEKRIPGLSIKIDEATSNEVGALHIPNSILQNIAKADIFIGDLSVIGKAFDSEKRIANPNVLIELGYAISELTWNRIILLFNKNSGTFPTNLPFDIEKRSCLDFNISQENDTNGIGQLRIQLVARVSEIIDKNPQRNIKSRTQAEIKQRTEDIQTITTILDLFRIKRMDYLFREGYARIDGDILGKLRSLNELMASRLFYLFDAEVKSRVSDFQTKLNLLPELLKNYEKERSNSYANKAIKTPNDPKRFDYSRNVIKDINEAFTALLDYVRVNYHEIDMNIFYKYEDENEG